MTISNEERRIFTEIQKKLYYMIPEKWDAIHLYASIIEEPFKKPVGEMYFYYLPKGILKRKPVNVYEIPGMFNIDEEGYNEIIQSLYSDIKKLRGFHREVKQELWSNITISIMNCKFKIEYSYEDLRQNAEFSPYERHIIWRYKYLGEDSEIQNKEAQDIIDRYLDSTLIQLEHENNEVYVEGVYEQPVHNIIDYEKTLTVEAAIASNAYQEEQRNKQSNEKNEKLRKEKTKKEKKIGKKKNDVQLEELQAEPQNYEFRNQDVMDKLERMKSIKARMNASVNSNSNSSNSSSASNVTSTIRSSYTSNSNSNIDDDMILSSDFMSQKDDEP